MLFISKYGCILFPFRCIHGCNHSNSNKNENVSGDPVKRERERESRSEWKKNNIKKRKKGRKKESERWKANTIEEGEIEIIIKMYVCMYMYFRHSWQYTIDNGSGSSDNGIKDGGGDIAHHRNEYKYIL